MVMETRRIGPAIVAAALLLGACAGTPPPRLELTAADAALKEAEEADAATHAPALLQQARDKLAFARDRVGEEDNVQARRLAEQAEVDAQLAEARARAEVANQNLGEVREGVQEMPLEPPPGTPMQLGS